jgi:hypothetical protein
MREHAITANETATDIAAPIIPARGIKITLQTTEDAAPHMLE